MRTWRRGILRERAAPEPVNPHLLNWTRPELAAVLLFRVPPTDRALAGWDPGYWHLPDIVRKEVMPHGS